MILGKPVIGSNAGGIPDLIRDGETGLLVSPGSVEDLTGAIESLLGDPVQAKRMGVAAANDARDRFDVRRSAADILGLLLGR